MNEEKRIAKAEYIQDLNAEIEEDRTLNREENENIFKEKFKDLYIPAEKEALQQLKAEKKRPTTYETTYDITPLFNKPKIIGIIGDSNTGKSNMIYYLITELRQQKKFCLYTYGLRTTLKNVTQINSVEELEEITNSMIIIDEMSSLFDLDNRKIKNQIETTIRLIFHNNNILLLTGLGENFKKFISAKIHAFIYKKIRFADLINGSRTKNVILNYKGIERGTTLLNLNVEEAIIYDGVHYTKTNIPYMQRYDSKKQNPPIFINKKCGTKRS